MATPPLWLTINDGSFSFDALAPGEYTIDVQGDGFQPAQRTVTLAAGGTESLDFRLRVRDVRETVTVGAEAAEVLTQTAAVSDMDREVFSVRSNRTVGDIIKRMPAAYLTGPPGTNKDVRLRGLDKEFTRAQVDGVQLPDGGEKRELQMDRLSSFLVQDVQIVRNPTAEYESDGVAGSRSLPAAAVGARNIWGARCWPA